ncbi:aminodeoxychorismate synthase component I [Pollutimonas sp. H1-120]|uniref:aminodeoxychorismate synthase component I n=1 Tax=Pollutimonas sp. H1-120 TaxID=3148824 RepID=UPI003B51AD29
MLCRYENRLSGQALELDGFLRRIVAHTAEQLPMAFREIEAAREQGLWTALLLDYELGEWLEPAFSAAGPATEASGRPRLTALVFERAHTVPVWNAPESEDPISLQIRPRIDKRLYLENIARLRASIGRGELYQANYTFPIAVESSATPRDLYRHIAARHPAAHGAYIEDGARSILSFSPELFVSRQGAALTVRPMKGTAPRHADPAQDQRAAQDLLRSEKNRAENLMIVDLLRNDLGRLATPGSVKVTDMFALERYPSVWTLTSTVTAQAPHAGLEDLLRALFPCGSITGAPKIAAMSKIRALETSARGIYCGSVGWLAPNGDCSLNVAIRTIEMTDGRSGIFGVGGGIVHDSQAELEWQECLWKARILETGSASNPDKPQTASTTSQACHGLAEYSVD